MILLLLLEVAFMLVGVIVFNVAFSLININGGQDVMWAFILGGLGSSFGHMSYIFPMICIALGLVVYFTITLIAKRIFPPKWILMFALLHHLLCGYLVFVATSGV